MTLFDGAPDETHAIFEEWGPKRHVPRNERLATRLATDPGADRAAAPTEGGYLQDRPNWRRW
jgi:hypothetical protein